MKRFLKIFGGIIIAAVLAVGGYAAGSHNGMDSISSALPRVSLNHAEPSMSPDFSEDLKPENKDKDAPDSKEEKPETAEPEKTGRTVVKTNESAAGENWTLLEKYDGSLTAEGEQSELAVYTSAETIDGEIIWDDGQNWVVEVSDGKGGYYVLMDKYINNGSVYFEVLDNDGEKAVNVFINTGAGMEIKQYTYSDNGFTETTLYNSGATNTLYSSVPDYK